MGWWEKYLCASYFYQVGATRYSFLHPTFWRMVNNYVSEKSPFPLLKIFNKETQLFYSTTKGVVYGETQSREVLLSASSHQQWYQNIVVHTLKTVSVNAFLDWRMCKRQDLLESDRYLKSSASFKNALNKFQSIGDLTFTISKYLPNYANTIWNKFDEVEDESQGFLASEKDALLSMEKSRKRKRKLLCFITALMV